MTFFFSKTARGATAFFFLAAGIILLRLDEIPSAAHVPDHVSDWQTIRNRNDHVLDYIEKLGFGQILGPEDLTYNIIDKNSLVIYTGGADGWLKKLLVPADGSISQLQNFTFVGGRPLGVAFSPDKNHLFVCNGQGLVKVNVDGSSEVVVDEVDGTKFKFTDGVDVSRDGMVYFTEASYKYGTDEYMLDVLEGRAHGRLFSYDPSNGQTKVLVDGLYFANGVAVSPDQNFVVFCETPRFRCQKYYIKGEKKGKMEIFVDKLPGFIDNIRYDGEGRYWIGFGSERTLVTEVLLSNPLLRTVAMILLKLLRLQNVAGGNGGVLSVSMEGELMEIYKDPRLSMVTGGIKIGDSLYFASLENPYIGRLNLTKHAAARTI